MKISLSSDSPTKISADLLAVGVKSDRIRKDPHLRSLDEALGGTLVQHIKDEDFQGKRGEALKVPTGGKIGAPWLLIVGIGSGRVEPKDGRGLAVAAARAVRRQKTIAVVAPDDDPSIARAAAEGAVTGAYRYTQYLTGDRKPKSELKGAMIVCSRRSKQLTAAVEQGKILGEAINLARDLVNAPPNDLNPPALADVAKQHATAYGVKCKVWDKAQIKKAGMHLLLAVNAGSGIEPRFIDMHYKPPGGKKVPKVCFIGKGITFDSGGLCLKPPKGMLDMKCDMAGAAVTMAVVVAAARLKLPVEVRGLIGATENMSGDFAYRPGDVFPSLDGKTVEIINTDAEGRLVMADVLTYAHRTSPDYMIDHATLTGACMVALGPWTAGLFANDEKLASRYAAAAEREGEAFWRLPLDEDLAEGLKSDIADLKHTGEAQGGAISAALFLREFVGKAKWAHVDIAGPAHLDRPHGTLPKGGTGFGVSTAIRFLEELGR